ncbi:MAG: hypothetical protein HOE90_14375 [Bacteriovoracaceae bacterium]|jgi:hypothetical protein|nr:hypothetical protein [Bacteriovoracaceae bacterium]
MRRVKKAIIFIIVVTPLLVATFFGLKARSLYKKNQHLGSTPLPYYFGEQAKRHMGLFSPIDGTAIEEANLLFIGGKDAISFLRYKKTLQKGISLDLTNPMKIYPLVHSDENIHRLMTRLNELVSWPKITIFLGGESEGHEKIFEIEEYDKILNNLKRFANVKLQTVIDLFPFTARLIYRPFTQIKLDETVKKDKQPYFDFEHQKLMELKYKFFEIQLESLVRLSRVKKSHLILMTSPINLRVLPKRVCSNSKNQESAQLHKKIFLLLKHESYKEAFTESKKAVEKFEGNALSHYLKGITLSKLGRTEEAIEALLASTAFDCRLWRSNLVTNSIIRKISRKFSVPLFDYEEFINSDFGKNTLFQDKVTPQDFYTEKAARALGLRLKNLLQL